MEISRTELQYLLDLQLKKTIQELQPVITECVSQSLNKIGLAQRREWLSQNQAYRMYGRGNVKKWIEHGWLPIYSDGDNARKRILRIDLERCVERNNKKRNG